MEKTKITATRTLALQVSMTKADTLPAELSARVVDQVVNRKKDRVRLNEHNLFCITA